jgi:Protein of unknown function (DUF3396)
MKWPNLESKIMSSNKRVQVPSSAGELSVVNAVLIVCFFIRRPVHEVYADLEAVLQEYLRLIPVDALKWVIRSATSQQWEPVNENTIASCRELLRPPGSSKRPLTSFHLRDVADSAPTCTFSTIGMDPHDPTTESATWVQMTLPPSFIADGRLEDFVSWVERLSELVSYSSAYCSPSLVFFENDIPGAFKVIRAAAARFRGYDIQFNRRLQMFIDDKCRGARWLTFLSNPIAAQLGGASGLRKSVGSPVTVRSLTNGVMLRAGELPEVGDVNRREGTPLLSAVAKAIEPVTLFDDGGLWLYLAERDDDALRRWERRFLDS